MIFLIMMITVRAETSSKPDCYEENSLDYDKVQEREQQFILFETKIKAKEDKILQQGSIINVPTHCPPNMLKIGNRCRSVY